MIEGRGVRALVDVGCGDTMGPALGKLPENLVAAGKSLDSITHVLLTHIHPDHSNGLIDGAGNAYYPNAEIAVQDIEYRFGVERDLSEAKYERQRENMVRAKASVVPYAKQITRIADGEFLPGILAQMSPGHTAGHSVWIVEGGGESVMIWGDTLHMPFLQLQRPDIGFVFDADPQQAAKSRLQLLDQTSADGTRVAGMHQDFPGYGYVKRRGDRFVIEQAR